ncbi:MAG: NADH:ubiquinone oxidoreductase [Parcubacteria group bacterium]
MRLWRKNLMKTVNCKLKIGIFSLTGCEGCCFSVLDLKERFLELADRIDVKHFRLFEDVSPEKIEELDAAFVEGSPLTEANVKTLKQVRAKSSILIAMGSCACQGGIYHLKQYQDKDKIFNAIYGQGHEIENLDVLPINKIVKVDFNLPGCPVNGREFLHFVYQLLIGKNPSVSQLPVCYECQAHGYECLLLKNKICLGPITLAGCDAVCLKSKQGCGGCRGLVEEAEVDNLVKKLRENNSDKEINKALEVFGMKELVNL